jgi:deoxyribonuclease V
MPMPMPMPERLPANMRGMAAASRLSHDWDVAPREAVRIQDRLREKLREEPLPARPELVAGGDVSFNRRSTRLFAGIVVCRLPGLAVVDRAGTDLDVDFPYVPGLLSFREVPALRAAWTSLSVRPDVLFLDGQGYAHPRRLGLACHAGLVLDLPTVGVAKSRLVGTYREPGRRRGCRTRLVDEDEVVGACVRTRDGVKPIYVSRGHRCDLESAVRLVLRCGGGFRVPEPTRQAHLFVNELRRRSA